jgi:hypothetical protein
MFARIGVMRALNRHVERVFDSSRKEKHWGKRKLARDEAGGRRRSQHKAKLEQLAGVAFGRMYAARS